ncbi:VOC family protein [Vagococcus elongatus]|uniref:Glyoxylase n=1 Tax=Vagococcus elongatus TaxID=180344 RepID=A0A430B5Y8_9ENTE|nr:VOC family protein [Vagococcus elongatus]RSU15707.1 glyoxylase [Vagococcus elongatus]
MKLDMIGIIVEDMAKAIDFYQILGFEVKGEKSDDYTELVSPAIRISLNSKKMITGIYGFEPALTGERLELAFLCDTPLLLEQKVEQVRRAGFNIFKDPWNAFWGQYYAILQDPDGNYLSLFCETLKEGSMD